MEGKGQGRAVARTRDPVVGRWRTRSVHGGSFEGATRGVQCAVCVVGGTTGDYWGLLGTTGDSTSMPSWWCICVCPCCCCGHVLCNVCRTETIAGCSTPRWPDTEGGVGIVATDGGRAPRRRGSARRTQCTASRASIASIASIAVPAPEKLCSPEKLAVARCVVRGSGKRAADLGVAHERAAATELDASGQNKEKTEKSGKHARRSSFPVDRLFSLWSRGVSRDGVFFFLFSTSSFPFSHFLVFSSCCGGSGFIIYRVAFG